jgi:hypothetical protein
MQLTCTCRQSMIEVSGKQLRARKRRGGRDLISNPAEFRWDESGLLPSSPLVMQQSTADRAVVSQIGGQDLA